MPKEYTAARDPLAVWIIDGNSIIELPDARVVIDLAPRFDWGRISQGTAQLAVAILSDAVSCHAAREYYSDFARDFLSGAPMDRWTIQHSKVVEWYQLREPVVFCSL